MSESGNSNYHADGCPMATAFETVPPDEAGEIDETAALTTKLQEKRARTDASQKGKILRGVHAKSHGCVKATFQINNDIAKEHRVGLFEQPGRTFDAWVRFSNAAVLREDDLKADKEKQRKNGSRGMAVKVLGVKGDMLGDDGGYSNQDFLMINTPEFAFANVRDYLRLDRILDLDPNGADPTAYFFPAVLAQLGEPKDGEPPKVTATRQFLMNAVANEPLLNNLTGADLQGTFASAKIAGKIGAQIVRNPMQVQYFGAAPFLFGPDRAMKFSATPREQIEQKPFDNVTPDNPSANYLREALGKTMGDCEDVCFDFMIQTRNVEDNDLGIEDATTTWPDEETGYVSVATITIKAPQEPHTDEALSHCEKLVFSPWHTLAAHQPIGGINRLRSKVYADSATHRGGYKY